MKYLNRIALGVVCLSAFASCADNNGLDFSANQPDSLARLGYLNEYDVLKNYVDRTANPNFKVGTGVTVSDYLTKGTIYCLTNSNFDEMTAGNAMKYGSCVANDGTIDTSTVKKFVAAAKSAGMSIYGHTLAWHSQQNNTYLNSLVPEVNRYLHINTPSAKTNPWDWGLSYTLDTPLEVGKKYVLTFSAKASAGMNIWFWPNCKAGTQYLDKLTIGTKWATQTITFTATLPLNILAFEFGTFGGDLYIDDLSLTVSGGSDNLIVNPSFDNTDLSHFSKPSYLDFTYKIEGAAGKVMTAQEKKDTLTWAMNNWISNMMAVCHGYVKAWDVVNEPLSGTDKDGDGFYDLQSATRGTVSEDAVSSNFYWQDYMGDLDYVRIAVAGARKYFAATGGNASDLKLFINDYNLESDWDSNKKATSLVHWIGQWEADGTTKIDGIGTQMHVTYYENATTEKSKEAAIVNMFKILAASGKLVRISELDMCIADANGQSVKTANATDAQLKGQAALYQFIVKAYFDNVPAAQRYGIAQWSQTDSPSDSKWLPNQPIGLWNSFYNRKRAYAGFANGLAGKEIYSAE